MNSRSGCAARTRPMSVGQKSSGGTGPARSPHVRANTSLVISIAMSQRTPSHCSPMSTSVSATASRSAGEKALSWHDVGPRREVRVAALGDHAGGRCAGTPPGCWARSSSLPARKQSGRSASHGWSGATWLGT